MRNSKEGKIKKLYNNQMDFVDWNPITYENVTFYLPDEFETTFADHFVIEPSHSQVFSIYDLGIYMSVERFAKHQTNEITELFDNEIHPLDAVHEHYIYKREQSLGRDYQVETSLKKKLNNRLKHSGWKQVVHGKRYRNAERMSYFTVTVEIQEEYYVFQWAGEEDKMSYFWDDFNHFITLID